MEVHCREMDRQVEQGVQSDCPWSEPKYYPVRLRTLAFTKVKEERSEETPNRFHADSFRNNFNIMVTKHSKASKNLPFRPLQSRKATIRYRVRD